MVSLKDQDTKRISSNNLSVHFFPDVSEVLISMQNIWLHWFFCFSKSTRKDSQVGGSEDEDDPSLLRSVSQTGSDTRLDTSIDEFSFDSGS